MDKRVPKKLADRQEFQRQQTINKVLHAMDYLKSQGMKPSIKNLMQQTGLSRSVFAKPHVRELLESKPETGGYDPTANDLRVSPPRQQRDKKSTDERIRCLMEENEKLKEECALLRGRLFLLVQRSKI